MPYGRGLTGNLKPSYLGHRFLSHKGSENSRLIHPLYICPDNRVRPFPFKKNFAQKRNEVKLELFRLCFACSLRKFSYMFSLLFASNFSLRCNKVIFTLKRNEGKIFFSLQNKQNRSLLLEYFIFASHKHFFRIISLKNVRLE